MNTTIDLNTDRVQKEEMENKVLTFDQAVEYLGVEDYWLEELIHVGEITSLSIKDLDYYMAECKTEEIPKEQALTIFSINKTQ